jgi:hypothetical protein
METNHSIAANADDGLGMSSYELPKERRPPPGRIGPNVESRRVDGGDIRGRRRDLRIWSPPPTTLDLECPPGGVLWRQFDGCIASARLQPTASRFGFDAE